MQIMSSLNFRSLKMALKVDLVSNELGEIEHKNTHRELENDLNQKWREFQLIVLFL